MKPTQFELSTLAAVLITPTRNLMEAVELARDLWDAAGKSLSIAEPLSRDSSHLPLDDFLRELMPKSSVADRKKTFRDYLRWQLLGGFKSTNRIEVFKDNGLGALARVSEKADGKNITAALATQMRDFRKRGVNGAPEAKLGFRAWKKHESGKSRSVGATKSWGKRQSKKLNSKAVES